MILSIKEIICIPTDGIAIISRLCSCWIHFLYFIHHSHDL